MFRYLERVVASSAVVKLIKQPFCLNIPFLRYTRSPKAAFLHGIVQESRIWRLFPPE